MVKSRHRIPVIDIAEVTLTGCVKETARWLTQDRYAAGRLVDLLAARNLCPVITFDGARFWGHGPSAGSCRYGKHCPDVPSTAACPHEWRHTAHGCERCQRRHRRAVG